MLPRMAIDRSALADACFEEFGEAATYTPSGGAAASVSVIVSAPDRVIALGSAGAIVPDVEVDLRVSEVAAPAKGDAISVRGTTYTVATVQLDRGGVINKLGLDEA